MTRQKSVRDFSGLGTRSLRDFASGGEQQRLREAVSTLLEIGYAGEPPARPSLGWRTKSLRDSDEQGTRCPPGFLITGGENSEGILARHGGDSRVPALACKSG